MPKRRHRPLTPEQKADIAASLKTHGRLPPIPAAVQDLDALPAVVRTVR